MGIGLAETLVLSAADEGSSGPKRVRDRLASAASAASAAAAGPVSRVQDMRTTAGDLASFWRDVVGLQYQHLRSELLEKPVLVRGVSILAAGVAANALARLFKSAVRAVRRALTVTATFDSRDDSYRWVMLWLMEQPSTQRTNIFSIYTSLAQFGRPGHRPSDDDDDDGSAPRVLFVPGTGKHMVWFRGRVILVRRSGQRPPNPGSGGTRMGAGCETVTLTLIGRDRRVLEAVVEEARVLFAAKDKTRTVVHMADQYGSWNRTSARPHRPIRSVVLAPGTSEALIDDALDFLRSESWYVDRGIPYRRGYLLYGPPGTGKCLAADTPVLLPNGRPVPVQKVAVGDLVMGDDGRPRRVAEVNCGVAPLVRVSPALPGEAGAGGFLCTENHRLVLCHPPSGDTVEMTASDLLAICPSGVVPPSWLCGVRRSAALDERQADWAHLAALLGVARLEPGSAYPCTGTRATRLALSLGAAVRDGAVRIPARPGAGPVLYAITLSRTNTVGAYVGLTLAGRNARFVLGDGVVTHNSSFVAALAGQLRLNIYALSLSSPSMTDELLLQLLRDAPMRCVVLLEDVDAAFVERTSGSSNSVTFSGFLNCLDGVAAPEGRILFITTNHKERLDAALLRAGRIDRTVYFGKASRHQMRGMFANFFPDADDAVVERFAQSIPEGEHSTAEVQGFLMQFKNRAEDAAAAAAEAFQT